MTETTYVFHITMKNDRMGFAKRFAVEGTDYKTAIDNARSALLDRGYDCDDFTVIELARKTIVNFAGSLARDTAAREVT